jgi:hypothetical protein
MGRLGNPLAVLILAVLRLGSFAKAVANAFAVAVFVLMILLAVEAVKRRLQRL